MSRLALILFIVLGFARPVRAEDAPLWLLVAQSDVIASGRLAFDCRPPVRAYVSLPIRSAQALKGAVDNWAAIRWFSDSGSYAPSSEQLCDFSDRDVLVFAQRVEGGLHFAGHTPTAIRISSTEHLEETAREVARQRAMLAAWRLDRTVAHYTEVQTLIDQVLAVPGDLQRGENREARAAQQALLDRLVALGPDAVPALIMSMDDRRRLPYPQISLINNAPDAFEGVRHYGPKVVADVIDAILNDITGYSFGAIANGGTESERRRAIDGWRIYLAHVDALHPT